MTPNNMTTDMDADLYFNLKSEKMTTTPPENFLLFINLSH